jgi:hypothetical protein
VALWLNEKLMKTRINQIKKTMVLVLLVLGFGAASAQEEQALVKDAIEAKQFVFEAQTALPTAASMRQLSGEGYRLRVSGDSLVAHLPYFGRVYSSLYNGDGGYKFTSTQNNYKVKHLKRGGWDITLQPKDITDVREIQLTVSENGTAMLRVLSNNRQPISYNGRVSKLQ